MIQLSPESQSPWRVGDRVYLAQRPPYLKTADVLPMLRPPDVVPLGSAGELMEQRFGETWVVRFDRGAFLVDRPYLSSLDPSGNPELPQDPIPPTSQEVPHG